MANMLENIVTWFFFGLELGQVIWTNGNLTEYCKLQEYVWFYLVIRICKPTNKCKIEMPLLLETKLEILKEHSHGWVI